MCYIGCPQHIKYHEDVHFVLEQHAELDFGYCQLTETTNPGQTCRSTLIGFRANQSLHIVFSVVCLTRIEQSYRRFPALEASTRTITPPIRFPIQCVDLVQNRYHNHFTKIQLFPDMIQLRNCSYDAKQQSLTHSDHFNIYHLKIYLPMEKRDMVHITMYVIYMQQHTYQ